MTKIIDTNYDTVAALVADTEYIAIPVFEDGAIHVYRLPSGGAKTISGLLTLPEDAEAVGEASMDDLPDADAVYAECERILIEDM